MKNTSDRQLQILQDIERSFSKTLIDEHFSGDSSAANRVFANNLSLLEWPGLIISKMRYNFSEGASNTVKAKRLLSYCERAVPALTRVFGEAALVEALPQEAKNQEVLDMVKSKNAPKIAALIKQTL